MEVTNAPMKCAVKIQHSQKDVSQLTELIDISYVGIQSRKKGEVQWREIHKTVYYGVSSLDFVFFDYAVSSHQTYEYRNFIHFKSNDEPAYGSVTEIRAEFSGFLIADENNGYISIADPKCTYQRDFNVAFVKPYNSKYPHVIRNGEANSCSGSFEGVFNMLNDDCQFDKGYAEFEDEIVEFLSRPTSKVFKTHDGHIWYVHINTPIKKLDETLDGFIKLQFTWNEIGDLPENMNQMIARAMK